MFSVITTVKISVTSKIDHFYLKLEKKNETEILFLYDHIKSSDVCFAKVWSLG